MKIPQAIMIIFSLLVSAGAFVLSYLQFKQKGFLFNNAYTMSSLKERQKMDENSEGGSNSITGNLGFYFCSLGGAFLLLAAYTAVQWSWLLTTFWVTVIVTVIYAVVSSIKSELRK